MFGNRRILCDFGYAIDGRVPIMEQFRKAYSGDVRFRAFVKRRRREYRDALRGRKMGRAVSSFSYVAFGNRKLEKRGIGYRDCVLSDSRFHMEFVRGYRRSHGRDPGSESERERLRKYYAANRERILAKRRACREADPEGCNAYMREWRKMRKSRSAQTKRPPLDVVSP